MGSEMCIRDRWVDAAGWILLSKTNYDVVLYKAYLPSDNVHGVSVTHKTKTEEGAENNFFYLE